MIRNTQRDRFVVRPCVLQLEAREKPGSLLALGLDWPMIESCVTPTMPMAHGSAFESGIRRIIADATEDSPTQQEITLVQCDGIPLKPATSLQQRTDADGSHSSSTSSDVPALLAPPNRVTSNSTEHRPATTTTVSPIQQAAWANQPRYDISQIQKTSIPPTPLPFSPKVTQSPIRLQPANLIVKTQECDGAGVKASLFNSYEGTPGDDANLAVASGKGPFIGYSYTVGYQGPVGTVSRYDPFGGCGPVFTIVDPSGLSVEVRDVAVNTLGVYVAGTVGPDMSAFVYWLSPALVPLGSVGVPAPPGGSVAFNGIGLSPTLTVPNVYVTGYAFDPFAAPFDLTRVLTLSSTLFPLCASDFSFGTASRGQSIDVDRPQNRYIAGIISSAGVPNLPFAFRAGTACGGGVGWAYTLSTPAPLIDPDNGMNGVRVVGGSAGIAPGVYFTGSQADGTINPGFDNLLLYKFTPAGGFIYGWVHSMPAIDLSGRANAVNRAGEHFTASFIGTGAHDAFLTKFDPLGGILVDAAFLGGLGVDRGYGIDLRTTAPGDEVFMAGETSTPTGAMFPPLFGCDPTYNGMADGFNAKWSQPY